MNRSRGSPCRPAGAEPTGPPDELGKPPQSWPAACGESSRFAGLVRTTRGRFPDVLHLRPVPLGLRGSLVQHVPQVAEVFDGPIERLVRMPLEGFLVEAFAVEAGDFMWLRAFCPQACYADGPGKFRYLPYKDVNRQVKLT